jgi:DNA-binding CsgD family transcriptional regulator
VAGFQLAEQVRAGRVAGHHRDRSGPVEADHGARGGPLQQLAADGLSNREIAQNLFITARPPKGTSHTYEKLAITSRQQLPAALAPRGIAPTAC